MDRNTKFEALNSKQYLNPKFQCSKLFEKLKNWLIGIYLGFRILYLEFAGAVDG